MTEPQKPKSPKDSLPETDEAGDIILKPITGWTTGTLAEIGILLAIEYPETPVQLASGLHETIQFALMPQQALALAEKLTTLARKILDDRSHAERRLS